MDTKYHYHKDGIVPPNRYVFVFGSNLKGRHGLGAALLASQRFGAVEGEYAGLTGNSYAIATKDRFIKPMSLESIGLHVREFVRFTHERKDLLFFVTRVGCGLAGHDDKDMAVMFKGCYINCSFAKQWEPYLH